MLLETVGPDAMVATDAGVPGGIPLRRMMAFDNDQNPVLVPRTTFTEGYRSAYLTTEVWAHFDEVWVQPMYIPVKDYAADGTPTLLPGADGAVHPIFGVGSDSKFYSPFWQRFFFEVPPGGDLASFKSVRDVVDRGVDITAAGGRLAVIAPDSVGLPPRVLMTTDGSLPIGGPTRATGILDGQDVSYLDFGGGTFTWNDDLVLDEAPIFVWVARDAGGQLRTLDIPTVAGTGPLFSNRAPKIVDGEPYYGSYWRLYTVEVQPGMAVFAPPGAADVRAGLAARPDLSDDAAYGASVTAATVPVLAPYEGRVAVNPSCFGDVMNVDPTNQTSGACQYLDSQAAIEASVPSDAIQKTDILVTCPFITYDGAPVLLP